MAERNAQEVKRTSLKTSIDAGLNRKMRADATLTIRKNKRLESQMKRRITDKPEPASAMSPSTQPTEHRVVTFQPELLPEMTHAVMKGTQQEALEATRHFREILSIPKNPPIQDVIDCGILPRLITFLKFNGNPKLQLEAAWALTNIASGTSKQTQGVVDAGAIPVFVALINSPDEEVKEQAVWGLGNICGDSPGLRDKVLAAGVMAPLLAAIEATKSYKMLRNATWTLSNLSRGTPAADFRLLRPMLPILARLLQCKDKEVLEDACWAFSYLSERKSDSALSDVVAAGVAGRLVELLQHPSHDIQVPALRTVGNIATGSDAQTDTVLTPAGLAALAALLGSGRRALQKEAAWTVSNMTAGNERQIQRVLESEVAGVLVAQVFRCEFAIRRECAWALCNAVGGGSARQIAELARRPRAIEAICHMLGGTDVKMLLVCLDALRRILEVGETQQKGGVNPFRVEIERVQGLDKLEAVQNLEDDAVYDLAAQIVEEYFDAAGNDEDENLIPALSTKGEFTFSESNNRFAEEDLFGSSDFGSAF